MSLLTPLITRNSSSTIPTELKRHIATSEIAAHGTSRRAPRGVAAVERQEREQVDHSENQRDEAEEHERIAGAGDDRFVRDLGDADDAVELMADLRAGESAAEVRERSSSCPTSRRRRPRRPRTGRSFGRGAEIEADQHRVGLRAVAGVDRQRHVARAPDSQLHGRGARQPSFRAPAQRCAAIALSLGACSRAVPRQRRSDPRPQHAVGGLAPLDAATVVVGTSVLDRRVEVAERDLAVEVAETRTAQNSRKAIAMFTRAREDHHDALPRRLA